MLSIVVISDVHIKDEGDKAFQVFHKFMNHEVVKSADRIVLLGDIFDLMAGDHWQYFRRYERTFSMIQDALERGQEIQYYEGNHDVHLSKLFDNFLKNKKLNSRLMKIIPKFYRENRWEKAYYYAHGDEIEVGNEGYKKYKNFISSRPLKFLANYLMPYKVLTKIGEAQSEKSRKRSNNYNEDKTKVIFRESASLVAEQGFDYIICGHSHVKDEFVGTTKSGKTFVYLNNGFAPKSKSFIHIKDGEHQFIDLNLPSV